MYTSTQLVALLAAMASTVVAHGHIDNIWVDGTATTAYDPSFQYANPAPEVIEWSCPQCLDNGFVSPDMYTNVNKIACHKDATPGKKVATVKAGGTVKLQWNTWPESHVGPIIDYMAKVSDPTKATAGSLNFFKVAEAAYDGTQWATTKLIKEDLTWSVKIPASLAPGNYVLRHEIIALHSAGQPNGAQNYPKCINLKVTGSGTANPAGVTADKFYTPKDAGLTYNVYNGNHASYPIPGPKLFATTSRARRGSRFTSS